jgi:hypothetical protein
MTFSFGEGRDEAYTCSMNDTVRKALPYLFLLVLFVLLVFIKKCRNNNDPQPRPKTNTDRRDPSSDVDRDRGFDRRVSYLEYSNHARCRMDCRHITQAEVEQIMRDGKINYNKSDLQNARCPRYAIEGLTKDNQDVRIVFAQCNESTTVVTVIDLDKEWSCDCPGDDKKYQNKN